MSDNPYQSLENPAAPPQKKSRTLLWVILGALALMSLLCCCGGPMLLSWGVQDRMTVDPIEVGAKADAMLKMDRPEDLTPAFYMDMIFMKIAVFAQEDGGEMMCQMAMDPKMAADRDQMRSSMEQQLEEQASQNPDMPKLVVEERETREYQVRGQPVSFDFNTCVAEESQEKYYQVSGVVDTQDGSQAVMILLQVKAENFSEEQIAQMIESIE